MAGNFNDTAVKTVNVEVRRLAKTLTENLETHQREYAEARRGFESTRTDLIRKIQVAASTAAGADTEPNRKALHEAYNAFSHLEKPVDHSNEYKQAIRIMEWETREKIDLSINDFECYVEDNWNWKNQFKNSHTNYTVGAARR